MKLVLTVSLASSWHTDHESSISFVIHAVQRATVTLISHMSSLIADLFVLPPPQLQHIYEKLPKDP